MHATPATNTTRTAHTTRSTHTTRPAHYTRCTRDMPPTRTSHSYQSTHTTQLLRRLKLLKLLKLLTLLKLPRLPRLRTQVAQTTQTTHTQTTQAVSCPWPLNSSAERWMHAVTARSSSGGCPAKATSLFITQVETGSRWKVRPGIRRPQFGVWRHVT